MLSNPFNIAFQIFETASNFPNFDDLNAFFPNSTGPWPDLGKVGKSLSLDPELEEVWGSVVACPSEC